MKNICDYMILMRMRKVCAYNYDVDENKKMHVDHGYMMLMRMKKIVCYM